MRTVDQVVGNIQEMDDKIAEFEKKKAAFIAELHEIYQAAMRGLNLGSAGTN